MSKTYWDAERLNREIDKIENAGFNPPTKLSYIQEGRTNIVVGNELKGAGHIRTYDEAVKYQEKVFGDKFTGYSFEDYQKDIKSLQDVLGGERSYQGEIKAQRKQLDNIIQDLNNEMGTNYSIKGLSTIELYDAVKLANQMVKDSNANSPMFYEYLSDILEGLAEG